MAAVRRVGLGGLCDTVRFGTINAMIKLRLKKFGKKNESSFRIVAVNSTSRRDGAPLQELGFYNPRTKELKVNEVEIKTRISKGAQPTKTVQYLLQKSGVSPATQP